MIVFVLFNGSIAIAYSHKLACLPQSALTSAIAYSLVRQLYSEIAMDCKVPYCYHALLPAL